MAKRLHLSAADVIRIPLKLFSFLGCAQAVPSQSKRFNAGTNQQLIAKQKKFLSVLFDSLSRGIVCARKSKISLKFFLYCRKFDSSFSRLKLTFLWSFENLWNILVSPGNMRCDKSQDGFFIVSKRIDIWSRALHLSSII